MTEHTSDNIFTRNPLATVLIVALLLRLIAVIFSKGYMASDDQFETVDVAYNWLRHGLWSPDGILTWGSTITRDIMRFPLYALSLWAIMKVYLWLGIDSLNTMMYGIRAVHAVFSLFSVYACYKIIEIATGSRRWALYGGLIAAVHFALPFLAVRNLIEMVGAHFWMLALLALYIFQKHRRRGWLIAAGLLTGLAWMIRFEIIFAALVVPPVLWYESKKIKGAIIYGAAFILMLLVSGMIDWIIMDKFAASSINHIRQVLTEPPPYKTSFLIYPGILIGFFIPPLSLLLFFYSGFKSFWSRHRVLIFSTLCFIVIHTVSASRQERYMIPIIFPLLTIFVLGVHHQFNRSYFLSPRRRLFKILLIVATVINIALLIPLTVNYGKKGLVDPLVKIEKTKKGAAVAFVSPDKKRIYPRYYGGFVPIKEIKIKKWGDLKNTALALSSGKIDFFILYPPRPEKLPLYLDSLRKYFGPVEAWQHSGPSSVDFILHKLNPRHNPTNEAWTYKPFRKEDTPPK